MLTLPASFDEVAREMTVQAAALAHLPRVILIEEPQAAFYAWVYKHRDRWESLVSPGQKILVCDVGGGTSDFTLIRVRRSTDDEQSPATIQFHRMAVGEHLILGGDNLDLCWPSISNGVWPDKLRSSHGSGTCWYAAVEASKKPCWERTHRRK